MIVVDANVTVYLYLRSDYLDEVQQLMEADEEWIIPQLWFYEFRNAILQHIRYQGLELTSAIEIIRRAENQFRKRIGKTSAAEVMLLAGTSQCSSYDCEYVALAQKNDVKLVTYDKRVLREFPDIALRPLAYIEKLDNEKNA